MLLIAQVQSLTNPFPRKVYLSSGKSPTHRNRQLIGVLACIGLCGAAVASTNDQDGVAEAGFDELVVVANKDERPVREVAGEITVISSEDIQAQFSSSFADLFRYMPGLDHEGAGTRFGAEGVSIRGIGGNRVALEIDGVPLPEQFDIGNFSNATRDFLDAGFVDRVEVLRGPSSALYGSSAIGGVVAVRTPMPEDMMTVGSSGGTARVAYRDTDQSYTGQSLLAAGNNELGLIAGASWRDGEDAEAAADAANLDRREYRRRSAMVKLVGEQVEGHEWQIGVSHHQADADSELRSMLGSGRFRSTTRLEGDDSSTLSMINARYTIRPNSGWFDRATLSAYRADANLRQYTLDERKAARTPVLIEREFFYGQVTDGVELNLQSKFATGDVTHQLGIGIEWQARRTEEMRDALQTGLEGGATTATVLGETFPVRDFPLSRTNEWGAYLEDSVRVGSWTAIAAVRVDSYDLDPEVDPVYREDNPQTPVVAVSESEVSPKLGVVYHWSDSMDVYLQYARGFRAPPFEDANIGLDIPMFNIRAIPNPDLRSETSDGLDLGIRWHGNNTDFRLSVFRTRYEDFIETKVRLGADPETGTILFQSQNINDATIEGVEARLIADLSGKLAGFGIEASAFLSRGDNEDTGEPLNSVGPAQAVIGARWISSNDKKSLRLLTTVSKAWSRLDDASGELFKPAGYGVVDLLYSQQLTERVRLDAGLFNLLDKTYWNWSDVRGFTATDPVLNTLSRPGRGFSIGLNMNW